MYIKESCLLLFLCLGGYFLAWSTLFWAQEAAGAAPPACTEPKEWDFTEGTGKDTPKTTNKVFSQSLGLTFKKEGQACGEGRKAPLKINEENVTVKRMW